MITRHFKRSEFACKCGCGFDVVDIELVKQLELLRYHYKQPVIINSGCRCKDYNTKIGGSKGSMHIFGKAADFIVLNVSPEEVQTYLKNMKGGLGSYTNFTHIDVGSKRRWVG